MKIKDNSRKIQNRLLHISLLLITQDLYHF
jgi:hypothetical protein